MDKDFDFDNIGKRTPYRTPENFFEEAQHKILERTVGEQRRNRRLNYPCCNSCCSGLGGNFVYSVSPLYEYRCSGYFEQTRY